jgi:hypothetical protein
MRKKRIKRIKAGYLAYFAYFAPRATQSGAGTQLDRVNAVYSKYFPQAGPAKFACGVTTLYGGAKFEIQVIALA